MIIISVQISWVIQILWNNIFSEAVSALYFLHASYRRELLPKERMYVRRRNELNGRSLQLHSHSQ